MQREQDLADLLVADRRLHPAAGGRRRSEIAPYGFGIESELRGDAFLWQALAAEPKDLFDFDHRDLAIHPRLLIPGHSPGPETCLSRGQAKGGKGFEKPAPEGGKGFEKPRSRGGKGFEKVVRKGSLRFENRHSSQILCRADEAAHRRERHDRLPLWRGWLAGEESQRVDQHLHFRGVGGPTLTEWTNPTGSSTFARDYIYIAGRLIAGVARSMDARDPTPAGFAFTDQSGVSGATAYESNVVPITGLTGPAATSIAGGSYRICGNSTCGAGPSFSTAPSTLTDGQYVQVRMASSAVSNATVNAVMTVGTAGAVNDIETPRIQ
jgi:hypothetical protein